MKKKVSPDKSKAPAVNSKAPVVKSNVPIVSTKAPVASCSTPKKEKKVEFRVRGNPGSKVFLAGTFTRWASGRIALNDNGGCGIFKGEVTLSPGTYEYKFIVNDDWIQDPENPKFKLSDLGTINSVVIVE